MGLPTIKQFHHKRRSLFFIEETTAGTFITDALLYVAGNGTVPSDTLRFTPNIEMVERNPDTISLQPTASVPGAADGKISFTSRVITGAKGVAGPLDKLFLAAGEKNTIVAATSCTYTQDPSSTVRLSMGVGIVSEDGTAFIEYAISGAIATKKAYKAEKPGAPIMIDWEFTGKIANVSSLFLTADGTGAMPTITYIDDNAKGFRFIGATLTSGLLARSISKLDLDMGISGNLGANIQDVSGYDYGHFGPQNPVLNIDPAKVTGATAEDIKNMLAGGTASAGFTVTNAAGDKFTITIPALQMLSASDDNRDAVSTWGIKAACRRSQTSALPTAADSAVAQVFA